MKGSTLVEVIVASVIFLMVFVVSLDTSVRITAAGTGGGYNYFSVLNSLDQARDKYTSGLYGVSSHEEAYEWGTLLCDITEFNGYDGIYLLTVEAVINNDIKPLRYMYLFEIAD
ncbi:MAG: hypothetical protein LUD76_05295 [Alistipes sp.]|nr:hypothetical protein [Alistipes sp.]